MKKLESVKDIRNAMELSHVFNNIVNSTVFNDLMEQQYYYLMDVNPEGLEWHSNYNSFFYTIEDRNAFIESIIKSNLHNTEELQDTYNAYNTYYINDFDTSYFDELDEKLDILAKDILTKFEADMHAYENPDIEWENDIIEIQLDAGIYNDYYIDLDCNKVFKYHKPQVEYYEEL